MSKWCLFASVSMWIFSEVFPLKAWSVICTSSSHQFSFIIYKVFLLTSVKYRFTEMAHWTIIGNIFSGSFSFLESGAKQTVKHKYMHQLRGYMTMTLGVCEQLYTQLDVAAIQRLQSSESLVSVLISGNQGWDGPDNWQVVNCSVPIKKKVSEVCMVFLVSSMVWPDMRQLWKRTQNRAAPLSECVCQITSSAW